MPTRPNRMPNQGPNNQYYTIDNDGEIQPEPNQHDRRFGQDMIQDYGKVIESLTTSDPVLLDFELRLQGLERDIKTNKVAEIEGAEYKLSKSTAAHLVSMLRGISNQNTHFTKYGGNDSYEILFALNYRSQYWMMMQGEKIPVHLRGKIGFEMMCIAKASLSKANEGVILRWTKGSFGENYNASPGGGTGSFLDKIPFFGRKQQR